jgi:uncharacterized BrkB/YihY/UPF0761 family membrane protein
MEALEEKYVKHDSFEEIDRILTIVENTRSESLKAREKFMQLFMTFMTFLLLSAGSAFFIGSELEKASANNNVDSSNVSLLALYFMVLFPAALFSFVLYYTFAASQQFKKQALINKMTTSQATEVLRELLPSLSRSEDWSTLKKFELKLRLSKLGISSERLFSENPF